MPIASRLGTNVPLNGPAHRAAAARRSRQHAATKEALDEPRVAALSIIFRSGAVCAEVRRLPVHDLRLAVRLALSLQFSTIQTKGDFGCKVFIALRWAPRPLTGARPRSEREAQPLQPRPHQRARVCSRAMASPRGRAEWLRCFPDRVTPIRPIAAVCSGADGNRNLSGWRPGFALFPATCKATHR
jgi:hypothetical protein